MIYHFKIHKDGNGFWAECLELKGCHTQADSRKELNSNMVEALNLYLDEPQESTVVLPLAKKVRKGRNIAEVMVDPRVAFSFYLRHLRLSKGLTQKQAAALLGIKHLFSYQRLESSKTANPELVTIAQIKRVFPEFSLDDLLAA